MLDGVLEDVLSVCWESTREKIIELAKLEKKPTMISLLQLALSEGVSKGKINNPLYTFS